MLDLILPLECGGCGAPSTRWCEACAAELALGAVDPCVVNPRVDPQVPVFAAFRDEMHRLVELSADDMASRRHGRLTTALALVELNEDRGVFGPSPTPQAPPSNSSPNPVSRLSRSRSMTLILSLTLAPPRMAT